MPAVPVSANPNCISLFLFLKTQNFQWVSLSGDFVKAHGWILYEGMPITSCGFGLKMNDLGYNTRNVNMPPLRGSGTPQKPFFYKDAAALRLLRFRCSAAIEMPMLCSFLQCLFLFLQSLISIGVRLSDGFVSSHSWILYEGLRRTHS
jgi:hypothetical protein